MIKGTLLTILFSGLVITAPAQNGRRFAEVEVRTNAVCDMCKKTIETELLYEKGIRSVALDLDHNVIHVHYDAKKIDPARIRTAIAGLGYAADDVPPDMKARDALPECCRKEGCGLPSEKH